MTEEQLLWRTAQEENKTGLSDGENVEVIEGIESGEVILISGGTTQSVGSGMGKKSAEERLVKMETMLKEQEKLPDNWDELSAEEKTVKAREIFQAASAESGKGGGMKGMGGGPPR